MTLGTSYVTETLAVAAAPGQIAQLTPTQAAAQFGAGNIKTPTAHFTIEYAGQVVIGRKGVPMVVDAGLLAALTAAGAPVV